MLTDDKSLVIPKTEENEVKQSSVSLCPKCGTSFSTRFSYWNHMRTHRRKEGDEVFMCEVCGKLMSNPTTLKNHMMIHTGNRPHVCEICGKGLAWLTSIA